MGRDYLKNEKTLEILGSKSHSINSISEWADEIAGIMEELTSRQDLRSLSLLFWDEVLPARGLLSKIKRWCPYCYEEMLVSNTPIYEPLIWCINQIKICDVHKIELVNICPFCHCAQFILDRYSYPGYCSYCGKWLGICVLECHENHELNEDQFDLIIQVGELLAHSEGAFLKPAKSNISNFINNLINVSTGGSTWEFSKVIGRNHKTVVEWCSGNQIPELINIFNLCRMAKVNLLEVFTKSDIQIHFTEFDNNNFTRNHCKPRKNNLVDLENALEEALKSNNLPPPSVKMIAGNLGCDQGFLQKKFPSLCNAISIRYKYFISCEKEKLKNRIKTEVTNAFEDVVSVGMHPSSHRIGNELCKPGLMRSKDAIEAYYQTLKNYYGT